MLENPRLKYNYHVEFLDDENVLLVSEDQRSILSDKRCRLVLAEIHQNSISADELVAKLEGKMSAFDIYHTLNFLEKRGCLTEASPALPQEACAYWNSLGIDVNTLGKILRERTVTVETVGPLEPGVFLEAFAAAGVKTNDTGALRVIFTDDYERDQFRRINREALASKQPWMLVKPVGLELWLGPIFLPRKTGCWECLKQRLEINNPIDAFYQAQKNTEDHLSVPTAYTPLSLHSASGRAVMETVRWLYFGADERLEGKIITFDTRTFTTRSHQLVKRPQCKACGDPLYKPEPRPIILRKKSSFCEASMGGYREVSPADTLEKYNRHVSPITGVMPELKPYHSVEGTPIYNYSSGRNTALRSRTLFWLNQHNRSGNGGKGKNREQAKTGALCEAVERYSLTFHGDEPYIVSSLRKLGDDGIHPNDCMNYSESQYRNRDAINQAYSKFYYLVPIPFDETLDMHWTPVYSLTHRRFKYLPSCFCYAQYPAEDEFRLFAYPDTNGCAAGNSIEEALLQGFLELVERDGTALWWYNMLRRPSVDLRSFNDPYFNRLMQYYKSLNRSLYVLDLTADMQIPVFGAISHRLDGGKQDIVFGFGAHTDAKIGIERALIELNQIFPIADVPESDRARGNYRTPDKDFLNWLNTASMENQPYLVPLQDVPAKNASDYPPLCEPTIYDSLMFCLDAAAKQGLETLVLDMTQPDIGLSVVKVIVPGLRHFWKRTGPGRLYDVPVKMGRLKEPLKEEELNPVALFI
jgi:ribosomal protein S12 methylthiotransferase accessory factor